MRGILVALVACGASACTVRDPRVDVLTPANGFTITDHEPITFTVATQDFRPRHFKLAVDGVNNNELPKVTPDPETTSSCDGTCEWTIEWPGRAVTEGQHLISVVGFEDLGEPTATGDVSLVFEDDPELVVRTPVDEDLRGIGQMQVSMKVIERGTLTAQITIDEAAPMVFPSRSDCQIGCTITYEWDTKALPAGPHVVKFAAMDANGGAISAQSTVQLDDIVRVEKIQIAANVGDDPLPLEVEVYVYDDLGVMLGCAGSAHGLGPVDQPGTEYPVDVRLVNVVNNVLLGAHDTQRAYRFEVWEDDDNPVCPSPLNRNANDLLGQGTLHTPAQWTTSFSGMTQTFGSVPQLVMRFDRPLVR